ncbi:RNA polymerase sigma-70 factor [Spirosoma utsteinense]|uniref:RNA polymerase sigma-70 factor n=1 Tax=Spirosoma utsteinense TaxID=2585773 RepID=UPI0016464C86|nr:RNA polymerase sigma-70 factor [Spirosoma utsteinense]MBC3787805.1 RNA polymerase sigma-70 factor (ECF subfamily) [Spirosoma utsteinense]
MENDPDWQIQQLWETNPQEACEVLFRKYYVALCSHASRFVYSKEAAEDIVSEVFYLFYKEELYKNVKSSYRAYLMQAVRYRAYDYIRWELSKSRRGTALDRATIIDSEPSPSEIVQYDELYRSIELAIDKLPPQTKRIFLLSRFEGRKYKEIAGELAISVKTVETHMSKALSLLRQALRPMWIWVVLIGLI